MSALAELQRQMLRGIFSDAPPDDGVEIYRRNVLANLAGALGETYAVTHRLVGEAFFAEAARRFALESASRSGDLHEFGGELPAFLERYAHARSLPYLPDVARLEWAVHESRFAADAPAFDFAALARVPAGEHASLRFALHPSVRMLRSTHPVCAIWEANQPGRDGTPDRVAAAECALVWREGLAPRVEAIAPHECEFLARIAAGATLAHASEAMGEEDAARFLAPALARYAARGILAAVA